MRARRELSIRARLTVYFVASIAAILVFTGVALVALVHRSLVTSASTRVSDVMAQVEARLATSTLPARRALTLPMVGDVVVQVTSPAGTAVWAASSEIAGQPVLARATPDNASVTGLAVVPRPAPATRATLALLSEGAVQSITTSKGPALLFGFVDSSSIRHGVAVLLASVLVSFPLLLVLAGTLIWFGLGLALAPVEAIRRRVDAIAARDLSERVPVTGGDDEIARLARTVNAMLDRLEAANRFQSEFISNASHELRSPLTTLLATVERAHGIDDPGQWARVTETIARESRRLEGLIDDLFWLARHDEGRVALRAVDVDLDDLLFEEAQRIRLVTELGVDTSGVAPVRVVGDPAMLKRMVRNVVDNAARYASAQLTFRAFAQDGAAVVQVADDGAGIDVATSARFFQRFVRSDPARARTSGGSGLGLAIVADIVARHGGTARFVEVAAGSCLELRVPREAADPSDAAEAS